MQDPYDQDKHYVMKTVPRDLFNVSDQVESNASQSYVNEPYEHLVGPSIPDDNGEVVLVRNDVLETIIDVAAEEVLAHELEVESENESKDESEEEFEDESEEGSEDDVDFEDEP